jgi:hypothetical protein
MWPARGRSARAGGAGLRRKCVQSGAGRLHAQHAFGLEQHLARGPRVGRFHLIAFFRDLVADRVGRVALDQPPVVHQAHTVAALRLIEVSRGDQNRDAVFHQLIQDGPEIAPRDRIDAVGRLIQEQDFRAVQQRAHQAELLLHAAGKFAGLAAAEGLHAGHAQQVRQDPPALGGRDAEQVGIERHVFVDGEIDVEAEALGHVADGVFDGLGILGHVMARDPGLALARIEQTAQHPQRGGLARAIGADQSEDLAAGDLQIQAIDRGQRVEAPGEVPRADDPFHQFPTRISASAGMLDLSSWRWLSMSILMR